MPLITPRCLVLPLLALALVACTADKPVLAPQSLVQTKSGGVIGAAGAHDTYIWRGIPYAAPPVGELRWRAPQPVASWDEPREMLNFGPACVQPDNPSAGPNAPESEHMIGVEDCLTINVYAPRDALAGEARLPVMFWIHGGGNIMGSAQVYDGARLASTQNVIVVSLNYRLGILGWIRHVALRAPGASAADHSGNYGTLDIIAALHWLQDNIAGFGGDAGNVTVFGESAGGRNTWSMVQTPLAKGLFHAAIVQSGSLKIMDANKSESIDENAPDYPSHENNGSQLVASLFPDYAHMSAADLATGLRGKSPDEIYANLRVHAQGMYEQPRLFLDGHVFVEPALDLFRNPSNYNAVPIMTGTNRDEDKLFMMFDERWVDFRLGFLPALKDEARFNAAAAFGADTWRVFSVDIPAQVISQHDGPPVYTYRFDFDDHFDTFVDLPVLLGAAHALEIPFVFGSVDQSPWTWLFSKEEQRVELSDAMMSYWGEFAHTGNPGRGSDGSQTPWAPWQEKGEHIMIFDTRDDGGVRMIEDRLTIEDVKQRMMGDTRFSKAERCEAYPLYWLNGYMVTDAYEADEHTALCSE